jgi:hypothetical protein
MFWHIAHDYSQIGVRGWTMGVRPGTMFQPGSWLL